MLSHYSCSWVAQLAHSQEVTRLIPELFSSPMCELAPHTGLWGVFLILPQVAVSFTSQEVHFYDSLAAPDLSCRYKLQVTHPAFHPEVG